MRSRHALATCYRSADMSPIGRRLRIGVPVLLTLVMLAAPAAWAARPLDTEDTGTVPPAGGELELSVNHVRRDSEGGWALHAVVSVGLLPGLEARLESELAALVGSPGRDNHAGLGDSLIGVKYRLLDEEALRPAVLGGVAVRLPTGDERRGLGASGVDATILVAISKTFGPVALTWNGGYTFVIDDRTADAWLLAASLEYQVAPAWWLVGEVVSRVGSTAFARDEAVARAGAVHALTDRLKLDVAVGAGFTRSAPDVIVTIGLTVRLF